ncbi:hypothetical protein VIMS_02459 [Mycobacterium marinum]|uniref:hypothetical protein n=1 Tax=Mycobacterium marinum TaxID=1781 RepID=UPI000E3C0CC1|nr:hypothetical protein [Mycobacterium marinum]RFZ15029.1 hypothetical protein VIMS_02459 [Mycobacterium marinum]
MAHVHVEVEGRVLLDDDIEGWQAPPELPPPPDADHGPLPTLPPAVKPLLLLALGKAMHRALDEGPLLQPLTTELITRPTGFTISVDTA